MSAPDRTDHDEQPQGPFVELATASDQELAGVGRSRMFFGLRSGVELFTDSTMPEAVARAKEAAVLYDEVVFEPGLYEVSISEEGSMEGWTPPEELTEELLTQSRRVQHPGTNFSVAIGPQGGAEIMSIMDYPLIVAYASEYHTGILDELARFSPHWVKLATLGNSPLPMSTAPGKLWRHQQRQDRVDDSLMPEDRRGKGLHKREWIIKTFNQDSVASSLIGASFNPTSLFAPISKHRAANVHRDGQEALSIMVPNVGSLPWEAVIEFRDHGGSAEARAMLREFEKKASMEEPEDATAFLKSVAQDVNHAVASAYESQRRSLPEQLAVEMGRTLIDLVPWFGPLATGAASLEAIFSNMQEQRSSWMAALMILKRRS